MFDVKGRIKGEGVFDSEGKKDGLWQWYNEYGEVDSYENLRKGLLTGEYKEVYDNKNIRYLYNYKDNLLDGSYKRYNEYGSLIESKNFKEDKLNGTYSSYYSLGTDFKKHEGTYVDGNLEGVLSKFYDCLLYTSPSPRD